MHNGKMGGFLKKGKEKCKKRKLSLKKGKFKGTVFVSPLRGKAPKTKPPPPQSFQIFLGGGGKFLENFLGKNP